MMNTENCTPVRSWADLSPGRFSVLLLPVVYHSTCWCQLKAQMTDEQVTARSSGKTKAPLIVKMRIDEQTTMSLLAAKPNSLAMGTFCSMLVEYGLKQWEKELEKLNS
ncbi:MAG: hypothetical protein ACO24H_09050 [Polynucleobacter sp.]